MLIHGDSTFQSFRQDFGAYSSQVTRAEKTPQEWCGARCDVEKRCEDVEKNMGKPWEIMGKP
jgi:hypothetical protein